MGNQVCRNGICRNTVGAFSCQCNIGYTLDDSGKNCRGNKNLKQVSIKIAQNFTARISQV